MAWSRAALEARVAELVEGQEGKELVRAVRRFGEELEDEERELLGRVLLERARADTEIEWPRRRWW